MTAAEFLSELRERGIMITAKGDRLHIDAPLGILTPDVHRLLIEKKTELLAILREETDCASNPSVMSVTALRLPGFEIPEEPGRENARSIIKPGPKQANSPKMNVMATESTATTEGPPETELVCGYHPRSAWIQRPTGGWFCSICHPL
jgi:hypothetical protein